MSPFLLIRNPTLLYAMLSFTAFCITNDISVVH